eukprot:1446452-Heterocapsa_arctica.AAC.1
MHSEATPVQFRGGRFVRSVHKVHKAVLCLRVCTRRANRRASPRGVLPISAATYKSSSLEVTSGLWSQRSA